MKYYKIRVNADLVGNREVYPSWEYNASQKNSETNLKNNCLPDFEPEFSNVYIDRLSDVINDNSIGGKGFLVNEKLKKIIESINIDTHKFYNLNLFLYETKQRVDENYYWLQIVSTNYEDWIDYQKSSLYLFDDFEEIKIKNLNINNSEELLKEIYNTLNTDNIIIYDKLILNSNFKNLDLFYMDGLYDNIFNYPIVSEKLKNKIESNNVISFEFKEVNIKLDE